MHFTTFFVASLASVAVASPLVEERANTKPDNIDLYLADVATIVDNIHTLNKTLNTFRAKNYATNNETAQKIQAETNTIAESLQKGTVDVQASRVFNDSESNNVAFAILVNLNPATNSLLDKLEKKKDVFMNRVPGGDQTAAVRQSLIDQKRLAGIFGNSTVRKVSKSLRETGHQINAQVAARFDQAIAVFTPNDTAPAI